MADHAAHEGAEEHKHHSHIKLYMITGAILTIVTVIELIIPFVDAIPSSVGVPALMALSAFKLAGVVAIFMHLKGDANIYKFLFLPPMGIAVIMILVLMFMAVFTFVPFGKTQPISNTKKPKIEYWDAEQLAAGYAAAEKEGFTEGQELYGTYCSACHRADGGGLTGPAFTDDCWLHGPELEDHIKVLHKGVPGSAMQSWQLGLAPEVTGNPDDAEVIKQKVEISQSRIRSLAFYVHSLQTKEVPKEKGCEGVSVSGAPAIK